MKRHSAWLFLKGRRFRISEIVVDPGHSYVELTPTLRVPGLKDPRAVVVSSKAAVTFSRRLMGREVLQVRVLLVGVQDLTFRAMVLDSCENRITFGILGPVLPKKNILHSRKSA